MRVLCLAGILLVACSESHPAAAVNPTAAVTASSPSPIPTAAGDVPVTGVDFSCRLPVVSVNPGPWPAHRGGFISFPAAQLVDDPNGTMLAQPYPQSGFATAAAPVLYGDGGGFYDRAAKRRVPTSPAATSADGSAYAYVSVDSMAHMVDVGSGRERTFSVKSLGTPGVLDFALNGVYLDSPSALGGPGEGVWLLNVSTGSITLVGTVHRLWAVQDRKAWVARLDPRDKTVWPYTEVPPADSLVEVDLATGAETELFYRAGAFPWMIGLVSGRPLITVAGSSGKTEVRLLDRPGTDGRLIYSGSLVFDGYFQNYQGDGERIWLGSQRGIYLYRPDRGFQKVFAYSIPPDSGGGISPGGFCL